MNNEETDSAVSLFDADAKQLLIKNVKVGVDACLTSDVLIEDGKILEIGSDLENNCPTEKIFKDTKIIDAAGLILSPGSIQLCAEKDENINLSGGVTMILDNLSCVQGANTLEVMESRKNALIGKTKTNVGFMLRLENINHLYRIRVCQGIF